MKKRIGLLLVVLLAVLAMTTVALAQANRAITLTAPENFVEVKSSLKITATVEVLGEDAPKKTALTWETSDKTIARVDGQGKVTGVKPGTVEITCRAKDDKTISQTISIEVRQPVSKLKLAASNVKLPFDAEKEPIPFALECTVSPDDAYDATLLWTSSDENVVKVDENGVLTPVGVGKATVTAAAKSNPKKTAVCRVTVVQAVQKVSLSKTSLTVFTGKSEKLKAEVLPKDAASKKLTWTSSNPGVASVDGSGTVRGKGPGKATITCAAADGSGVEVTCEVTVIRPVTRVKIDDGRRVVITEGQTERLSVTVTPSDASNRKVKWSSDYTYVATVDKDGKVTAKNPGTAVITATAEDGSGKHATIKVVVEPEVPVTLVSIGTGRYLPNLLGMTLRNETQTRTIRDVSFTMELYTYDGYRIGSGSYSLSGNATIGPNRERTIKRTASGVGYASKIVITLTGVEFTDGTYYSIPYALRDECIFRVH